MQGLRELWMAPNVDAKAISIDALAFVAGDQELLGRLLNVTGLRANEISTATDHPDFLVGVLDFVLVYGAEADRLLAEQRDRARDRSGRLG